MNAAGFTDIAVSISLKTLSSKGMVTSTTLRDEDDSPYMVYGTSEKGEEWIIANQDKLVLKAKAGETDDIPF